MMSASNLEITRDIVIALIQKGLFDCVDKNDTYSDMHDERASEISKTFKEIHKAIYESNDEENKFWNR